jgi:formate hydrogenlyase subunit 3/multisubunit Na+/H+ antiporter MnhD subunit
MFTTLIHYLTVDLVEIYPQLQPFHGSVVVATFATFVMNPPESYKCHADHMSLLVGLIALIYLSATFVQTYWKYSCVGYAISVSLAIYYFTVKLEYGFCNFFFSMVLLVLSGCLVCYQTEYKDKMEYLEKRHT